MDAATLLQTLYKAHREKRLGDVLDLLDADFRYVVHLPEEALAGADRPRNKAETGELFQFLMDSYDFLSYDPGPIIVTDDQATVHPQIRFRHKTSGKVLETKLGHTWSVKDGKAVALDERHDVAKVLAFVKSVAEDQP